MLRKIPLISCLSLLITTSCFAGFYVGASVGPEGALFTQKSHVVRPGSFDVIDKEHFAGTGVFGSIFAGYGLTYKRYYLAGEINANLSSLEYDLTNKEFLHLTFSKTYFTIRSSEGVSLLPGYFISDNTLVYARIGYANGRLKISESDPTINSGTTNRNGIRYGVGIKHAFTPRLALRMDYSQIHYSTVQSSAFEAVGGVSKYTKISPDTAQVGFGLVLNFDEPAKVYEK